MCVGSFLVGRGANHSTKLADVDGSGQYSVDVGANLADADVKIVAYAYLVWRGSWSYFR